jgi:hypothetical protein
MTNSTQDLKPTNKELAYLNRLAVNTGTSYAYPRSRAESRREIKRMKALTQTPVRDRRRETKTVRGEVSGRLPLIADRLATSTW